MRDHVERRFLLLCSAVLLGSVPRGNAQNPIVTELRKEWERNRLQIMRVVEPMPEDKYQYRPTPKDRSFGENLVHVTGENMVWMEAVAGVPDSGSRKRIEGLKTRAEILKALTEYFEYGDKVLANLTDEKAMEVISSDSIGRRPAPRWVIVMTAMNHVTEHYGTLSTYLQLNGVVRAGPPGP